MTESATPRHGSLTRYVKHKCRCDLCWDANEAYRNTMYAKRDPATFPPERQEMFLAKVTAGQTIATAAWELHISKSTVVLLARSRASFRDALDDALQASPQRHQRIRWSPSHGTREAFLSGCPCRRCRTANAEYHRIRRL